MEVVMSYETKVLLIAMAEYAVEIRARKMYRYIAKIANSEGVVLASYEDALLEAEADEKKE